MEPIIRLKDFIDNMDAVGDVVKLYLNIRTGEFVTLLEEELWAAEEGEPLASVSYRTEPNASPR